MNAPQKRINYKLSIFLALCCLLLLVILLLLWQYGRYSQTQLLSELENIQADSVSSSNLPELATNGKSLEFYENMISRPLFLKGRRPVAVVESGNVQASSGKIDLILTGVVSKDDTMIAMLQDPQKQRYQFQLQDAYQDWQVEAIHADSIVFRRNDEENELQLRKPFKQPDIINNAPQTKAPAVAPTREQ